MNPSPRYPFNPDPHWLDAQYNNRQRVPQFLERYIQPWQQRSAQARKTLAGALDVPYTRPSHSAQTLDIFPAPGGNSPVLVFIHGGYWRGLDKADHSFVASAFVPLGYCTVVTNYSLCPVVTIPDIVRQQLQALAWVYRNIKAYGGNPRRISVIGHSAGGHLAAMMAACEWERFAPDLPPQLVGAALAVSGLYDLAPIMATPYLQHDLRLSPQQVQQASPAYFARSRAPLYSVCGGDESPEFLRHNQMLTSAWGSRAVPVCEALPGHDHFSVLDAICTPGERAHQLAQQMLALT